jgi:hypothetical protein
MSKRIDRAIQKYQEQMRPAAVEKAIKSFKESYRLPRRTLTTMVCKGALLGLQEVIEQEINR